MIVQALRKIALRQPDAEEGIACEGTPLERRTIKAGGKAFLFLGPADALLKLVESLPDAKKRAAKEPERFRVGANGWVKVMLGGTPPMAALEKWIVESHRAITAKKAARKKAGQKKAR